MTVGDRSRDDERGRGVRRRRWRKNLSTHRMSGIYDHKKSPSRNCSDGRVSHGSRVKYKHRPPSHTLMGERKGEWVARE